MIDALSSGLDPSLLPMLETVLDAVVVMAEDGRVIGWNSVAEQTFGWTLDEARGRNLADLVVPEQHRKDHLDGLRRLASGGKPTVLNRLIEITAVDRDGREIPIELSTTTTRSGSTRVFIGFIRDISERRSAEARIERQALENRLMFEITNMASESKSFEEALGKALEAICEITGWPVGHAFVVPQGNPNSLRSLGVWVEAEPGMAEKMREATDAITFGPGIGLPGLILATGKPQWISDTDVDANFPRRGNGFRGAFGFPLKHDGHILAILEFFSEEKVLLDPTTLRTVRVIGEQVGRIFERKRTQDKQDLVFHELQHRVKNILAVVQAVARQTFNSEKSGEAANTDFFGRLQSIAHAQDILVSQNHKGATFLEIIEGAIQGSGVSSDRVKTNGPLVNIPASSVVTISLAIHELCTNALKYGALSVPPGSVSITWDLEQTDQGRQFLFEWKEADGPTVIPPQRKGFGSSLLERGLAGALGGEIMLEYAPDGLICSFNAPLSDAS